MAGHLPLSKFVSRLVLNPRVINDNYKKINVATDARHGLHVESTTPRRPRPRYVPITKSVCRVNLERQDTRPDRN